MVVKKCSPKPFYVLGSLFYSETTWLPLLVLFPLAFTTDSATLVYRFSDVAPFLINLLMDWPYQHDIGFQYSYGSVTLLF